MAIFTALAGALLAGTVFAGTIAVPILAGALGLATYIGASYAMQALKGSDAPGIKPDNFSVQTTVRAAGDVPRSFNLGYSVTAGSRAYLNTWGNEDQTPNAYLVDVLWLFDLPRTPLTGIWVDGQKCTLGATPHPEYGYPVIEFNKDGKDHLWVKYYDGTQTAADPYLVSRFHSAERPYGDDRIGTGVGYAIVTALLNNKLFTNVPALLFETTGAPLYDPSRDSTNGGIGPHRWSDPSTWGGDGDSLPAVQAYNVLRGIYYNGAWLYGFQSMTAARLPAVNWVTQINKCRALIDGPNGPEPTYRSGGQINVSAQIGNTLQAILTSCQGRWSEIGGFYKVHLGAPDSPSFAFTDDEVLSTEEQHFAPFFTLADTVNGIAGTFPDPAQAWANVSAPPYLVPAYENRDGRRRLLSNPKFDFVPYAPQVQRLQKSAVEEARRERRHSIVLGPAAWIVEPGDVVQWTSPRNGYVNKLFQAAGVIDKANVDIALNITEVDPSDYHWDHQTEYKPTTPGSTIIVRPAPQGILEWFAEPDVIRDEIGGQRRPAIRLRWYGDMPGVVGVQYEVRLASDHSDVTKGRTDQLEAGALRISHSILPNTNYQVRGQYLPSSPRDMLWSDWLPVLTPDVRLSYEEFDEAVRNRVTAVMDALDAKVNEVEQRLSKELARLGASGWTDIKSVRSQLFATAGNARADIDEVRTVAVDTKTALADYKVTVAAGFGAVNSAITEQRTAIATLDGYAAASVSMRLDVNNYIAGWDFVNGGPGASSLTFLTDAFYVAAPGVAGGAPKKIFGIGPVNGVPEIGIRGNVVIDGSLTTQNIAAGAIDTIRLAAQAVTADRIKAGSITSDSGVIGALAIKSLSIGDNAVTVTKVAVRSDYMNGPAYFGDPLNSITITMDVDTTGLGGKTFSIFVNWSFRQYLQQNSAWGAYITINGTKFAEAPFRTNPVISQANLSGAYTTVASGGVMTFEIIGWWVAAGPTDTLDYRVMTAQAAKR